MPGSSDLCHLTVASARPGVRVIWLGPQHEEDIFAPQGDGTTPVLQHGHPGRIVRADPWHVTVEWLGLEEEPVSWGVGHNPEPDGTFTFLGVVPDGEWDEAARVGWWAEAR
ncbi:MAG: hypothetical protein LWW86_11680 [Micrococcales bacterium]|nr:hypothetical protein [Micrococcales bacterium]